MKYKCMIIDDDKDIRDLIESSIETELNISLDISMFDSGEAAVDECLKSKYDLVITDYKLPGINGLKLIDKIRKSALNKTVPVVFISGFFSDLPYAPGSENFRNVIFVSKPFDASKLARKIRLLLFSQPING